jgi:phosphatidylserine decarboxylase
MKISEPHQYIDRDTGEVRDEHLYQDRLIRWLYHPLREHAPSLFRAVVSQRMTRWLGMLNYDGRLASRLVGSRRFLRELGVDVTECVAPVETLNTPRRIFERQIRYWEHRPLPEDLNTVVSPADSRVLVGSFSNRSTLSIKGKFFSLDELLGWRAEWIARFVGGDFAVFRLTPEKYHYNHAPVSGVVVNYYEVEGCYHSCNPDAVVAVATPYSRNRRAVTLIDTDVPEGTGVGLVAMFEVVALMIGGIVQSYCDHHYDNPRPIRPGMFLRRGQPKSLYRPGSSTDVLVFQPGRVEFAPDLLANQSRPASSRFTHGFGQPLVETDVKVRSLIATRRPPGVAVDDATDTVE